MNFNPLYLIDKVIPEQEIVEFRKSHLDLNEKIQRALKNGNRAPIGDGVFDYEGYLKAKVKILWLMKEPYDTAKGENALEKESGGWYFSGSDIYLKRKFGPDRTTWYPIINTSHAILSGQKTWDQTFRANKNTIKSISDVLSHIAYINIQKLASLGREKTNNSVVHDAFILNEPWLQQQLNLLKPDIIIGANTLNGKAFEYFDLKGKHINESSLKNAYIVNNRLFIRTYHPSQRHIKKEKYINEILDAVRHWSEIQKN